jgi:hypothetical protein
MGQAKIKRSQPRLPDIPISESQRAAVQSLVELLNREVEDGKQRVAARRLALNRWCSDVIEESKIPKGKYVFNLDKMAFIDASGAIGKPV